MLYVINTIDQLKPILVGYRKSKGLTQTDMANRLNVSQQTYQVLEAKPQNVTIERLFKVLNILEVKFCLSQPSPPPVQTEQHNGVAAPQANYHVKTSSAPLPTTVAMRDSSKEEQW
jgi:HTH-type transcriptional regulator/antitoxin HipB